MRRAGYEQVRGFPHLRPTTSATKTCRWGPRCRRGPREVAKMGHGGLCRVSFREAGPSAPLKSASLRMTNLWGVVAKNKSKNKSKCRSRSFGSAEKRFAQDDNSVGS